MYDLKMRETRRVVTEYLATLNEKQVQVLFLASKIGDRLERGEEVAFDFRSNTDFLSSFFFQITLKYDEEEDKDVLIVNDSLGDPLGEVTLQRVGPDGPVLWYDAFTEVVKILQGEWNNWVENNYFANLPKGNYRTIPEYLEFSCKGAPKQVYFEFLNDEVHIIYYEDSVQDAYLDSLHDSL